MEKCYNVVKMRINRKNKKDLFLEAYRRSFGNVSAACRSVGIKSRTTVYKWMKKYPRFKKRMDEIDQSFVEFVESKLVQKINDGNLNAIKFYLVNRAADRWQDRGVTVNTQVFNKQGDVIIDSSDRELQEQLLGELQRRFNI